jgi:hypothetical protein
MSSCVRPPGLRVITIGSREHGGVARGMLIGRTSRVIIGVVVGVLGPLYMCATVVTAAPALAAACPNTAFRVGASTALPDCRAYEQVSPANKGGIGAYPPPGESTPVQVIASGEKLAYLSFSTFPGGLGSTALSAGHVSSRSAGGWQTAEWTPEVPKAEVLKLSRADYVFSEDLSQAVLQVPLMLLTPEATPYVANLYVRHPDGIYTLVNAAHPAILPETLCGLGPVLAICYEFEDRSAYAGASSDMRHVLFESTSQLLPEAPPTETQALYENASGHVRLAGILPDGTPGSTSTAGSGSSVYYASIEQVDGRVEHAMSRDGSRVVFQAPADEGGPDAQQNGLTEVYDRLEGSETIELSAPASGPPPKVATPESATFWDASQDGSRVFFTSSAELTSESNTGSANGGADLYEYSFERGQHGEPPLKDLTVDQNILDESTGAMVQGVAGVSSDGAYVYFVADGQLVEGNGVDGQPNLYVVHNGGSPRFIATLATVDGSDWTQSSSSLQSYVTPDGKHLEFDSRIALPSSNFPKGYDNHDQETGEPDREIYEYNAAEAEEASQLLCASCDPSGARPVGDAFTSANSAFSRARVISDNGARVFYTARTPLAPELETVFEFEQAGEGECANPLGCQYSLSGAGGTVGEQLLGVSASGDDVFIATASQLVPGDTDNVTDIYDARVDGGIAPPSSEPVCESGCRTSSASSPESSALVGATSGPSGNLSPPPLQTTIVKPKPPTRTQMLAKALKACRKLRGKHTRTSCEKRARARYGPRGRAKRTGRRASS